MNIPQLLGSKKSNNAVVSKIAKEGIYVSPNKSCDKSAGCHNCSACSPAQSKTNFFCSVPNPSSYTVGQCIRITYFSLNEVLAALIVFGLPIFCAITTFIIWNIYFTTNADSLGSVLVTVLALIIGFIIVYIIEKVTHFLCPVTIHTDN